jgi:hypothetical protein
LGFVSTLLPRTGSVFSHYVDAQVRLAIPSIATVGGYRGAVVYQYLKNRLIPYLKIDRRESSSDPQAE